MNAPVISQELLPATRSASALTGLGSAVVADRVASVVQLITGAAVGFGAVVSESVLRSHIEALGRSDAHLVIEEVSAKGIVGAEFAALYPELHGMLQSRKRGG